MVLKKWAIAFTHDGRPGGRTIGWKETSYGSCVTELFADRDDALEALDLAGWTGYVREYEKVDIDCDDQ